MPITTLVTGAAGFAGGHLIRRLRGTGRVIGWQRPGGRAPKDPAGAVWREVDVTDRPSVREAVAQDAPDVIVHLAGAPSVRTSWQSAVPHLRLNVFGTHLLLEAVRHLRHPCRVVVASSAQVYQASDVAMTEDHELRPSSPYGFSKLAEEQLALRACTDDALDVVVARPFNHIGPGQAAEFAVSHFARQIARIEAGLEPPTVRVGNLAARRDICDVRDVADAYVRLAERGRRGGVYNICSGRAPMMKDVLDALLGRARVKVTLETDESRLRPHDLPILLGDGSRISAELGWTPRVPLEQTLDDILEYWRSEVTRPAQIS
jgi:GDP-4-dehydro-6-deoxy-D-mannose reductase